MTSATTPVTTIGTHGLLHHGRLRLAVLRGPGPRFENGGTIDPARRCVSGTYARRVSDQDCPFCKIAAGDIPAEVVHRTETTVAFRDLSPQAPTHILVI